MNDENKFMLIWITGLIIGGLFMFIILQPQSPTTCSVSIHTKAMNGTYLDLPNGANLPSADRQIIYTYDGTFCGDVKEACVSEPATKFKCEYKNNVCDCNYGD